MAFILQVITSSLTLTSVYLAGNGDQRFNFLGLFNQILWAAVIFQSKTYGLLILTVAMTITYSRNILKHYWRK